MLDGYTSTTESIDVALKYIFRDLSEGYVPVIYQITGLSENGFSYFQMDSKEYTPFLNDKEVLLATGLPFYIIDISE